MRESSQRPATPEELRKDIIRMLNEIENEKHLLIIYQRVQSYHLKMATKAGD